MALARHWVHATGAKPSRNGITQMASRNVILSEAKEPKHSPVSFASLRMTAPLRITGPPAVRKGL